ncbi:MAG: hypothetical protein A2V88_09315 [Elusimicrobia bacterium RBG_16_66_12]|nr:MAG: hypothetical protein A2V88_09315 [Elusimicrobia bacterium RBG_16_66_12]
MYAVWEFPDNVELPLPKDFYMQFGVGPDDDGGSYTVGDAGSTLTVTFTNGVWRFRAEWDDLGVTNEDGYWFSPAFFDDGVDECQDWGKVE